MSTSSVTRFTVRSRNSSGAKIYYNYKLVKYNPALNPKTEGVVSISCYHVYYEATDANFADITILTEEELEVFFLYHKHGHKYIQMFKDGLSNLSEADYKRLIEYMLQGKNYDDTISG